MFIKVTFQWRPNEGSGPRTSTIRREVPVEDEDDYSEIHGLAFYEAEQFIGDRGTLIDNEHHPLKFSPCAS